MANKDKVELNKEHRFYKNPLKKGETYSNPNHPKYKAAQKAEEDRIGYSFPYDDEGNLKKFPPYEQQKMEEIAMIATVAIVAMIARGAIVVPVVLVALVVLVVVIVVFHDLK